MKFVLLVLLLAGGGWYYFNQNTPSYEGRWRVDVPAMVERARADNLSERQIDAIQTTFAGGQLEITGQRMRMSIEGMAGAPIEYEFETQGDASGNCSHVITRQQHMRLCLEDGKLVVYDPSTPVVAIHRRI